MTLKRAFLSILTGILLLGILPHAGADILSVYEFGLGGDTNDVDNYTSFDTDPNTSANTMVRGSRLGTGTSANWPNPTSATVYSSATSDWRLRIKPPTFFETEGSDGDFLNDFSRAFEGDSYLDWTLTPEAGFQMDLTSFGIDVITANSRFFYYYLSSDIDGFDVPIGSVGAVEASTGSPVVSLTGSQFQNLTTPVTFRLYVWGNQGGSSGSSWQLDTIAINGTTSVVPEPASFSLMLICGLGLITLRGLRLR